MSDGRASIILNPSGASNLSLTAYVVSAGELVVMRTDPYSTDGLLSGTILSQASISFDNTALNSPTVYYELGLSSASTSRSFAEIGLMTADGKGGLAFVTDAVDGLVIQKDVTFTGTYSVLNAGRVAVTSNANASWVFYLVNKNQAFLLDTSRNTAFGFVEPQAPAPTGGFTNSSFSGPFSAGYRRSIGYRKHKRNRRDHAGRGRQFL